MNSSNNSERQAKQGFVNGRFITSILKGNATDENGNITMAVFDRSKCFVYIWYTSVWSPSNMQADAALSKKNWLFQ